MTELVPTDEAPTFYRTGVHGLIELVDARTGAVISVQSSLAPLPQAEFIEVVIEGKTVLVQSGVDGARLTGVRPRHLFSKALADIITQKIIEGTPWSRLPREPGMPDLFTLSLWRRENSDFDSAIRFARKMRAERLRDEALELAQAADGSLSDMVAGTKLAVETLKWAAEKDDPETYGAQTKVKLDGQVGLVHLVVETGIRRKGDEGAKDVGKSSDKGQVVEAVEAEFSDVSPSAHPDPSNQKDS